MIDTFMVLWNRDRRRKGLKLFLTFLLIGTSASLLLATLYIPHLIPLLKRENFARNFISKTTATATVQEDQADQAHKAALPERARVIETTPTAIVETPCVTSVASTAGAPTNNFHASQKKHVKHKVAKKPIKKAHQRREAKPSSHRTSKNTTPLKIFPPPGTTLRPTGSSTGPVLKPTATHNTVPISVTPVSTATTIVFDAVGTVVVSATLTTTPTIESDMTAQHGSGSAAVSLLRRGGGPIFDDASSTANDDPSYQAIAPNDGSTGTQSFALSCVKKRTPVG